jgi:sn-glycerol 3-phosphate transport system ATP-binding protein
VTSLFVTHDQVEAMTLAQRMVVMNEGRMEQIGTPEEVYARPATTFVASFIGSPPMNLLLGEADGSRLTIGGMGLTLPRAAPRSGPLIVGVRPEHADIGRDGGWPLAVELTEMLGAERLIHGRLGEAPFTVRFDGTLTPPAPGETVMLRVAPERVHWFDAQTRQRVA